MKKLLASFLTLVLLFASLPLSAVTVSAAGDDISTAGTISIGETYSGSISASNSIDVYKFNIASSGRINIKLNAYIYATHYYLYDVEGNTVWENGYQYWNGTAEVYTMDAYIDLTGGTYYFAVKEYKGTGNYNFQINFTSAGESFAETLNGNNQNISEADSITLGKIYKGQLANNDTKDFYKLTITSSGRINIQLNAYIYATHYYLYDVGGNTVWENEYQYWNSTAEVYTMDKYIDLTIGTYYFAVKQYDGTGNYNFKISCAHTYDNNCDTTCNVCGATRTIAHTYTNSCDATCNICGAKRTTKHIYSSNCDEICNVCGAKRNTTHSYKTTTTTKATLSRNGKIVKKCSVCGKVASTSAIKRVKTVKFSATSYVYNGKAKTPTVTVKDSAGKTLKKGTDYTVTYAKGRKNVGSYKVTIKFKGNYSGTKTLTFKILPKAASINKLTAKSKAITVKLNRVTTQSTGYQIQYSTSSKFTSAKTVNVASYKTSSKTISGLKKGKKYYVRVRTYKTVGGTKFYSAWSTAKSVKTK